MRPRIYKSVPVLGEDGRLAAELMVKAMRSGGASEVEIAAFVKRERAALTPVVVLCHDDDPLLNGEEVLEVVAVALRAWHDATGMLVQGEGFEHLLAKVLRAAQHRVRTADREPGESSPRRELQNQWVMMSQHEEVDAAAYSFEISSVLRHHQELESPGSCAAAVAEALHQLSAFERVCALECGSGVFPTDALGEPERPAVVYRLLEVPKAQLQAGLQGLSDGEYAAAHAAGGSEDWISGDELVELVVTSEDGSALFAVTLSQQHHRTAIRLLHTGWCEQISEIYADPLAIRHPP